jgi:hypothetical protein
MGMGGLNMAKTIHMQEFDPVEGSGMFEDKGQRFYVNINIGIVTITPVRWNVECVV